MSPRQILGLIGSIILFLGVFAPIVSAPIVGNINYFQNGKGDGIIIIFCAVSSLVFILIREFRGLWITGIFSIGLLAFTFINFRMNISDAKLQMDRALAGNPFRGLAELAIQSVQIQWGWAILIVGAGLIIASAAMKEEEEKESILEKAREVGSPQLSKAGESASMDRHSKTRIPTKVYWIATPLLLAFIGFIGLVIYAGESKRYNQTNNVKTTAQAPAVSLNWDLIQTICQVRDRHGSCLRTKQIDAPMKTFRGTFDECQWEAFRMKTETGTGLPVSHSIDCRVKSQKPKNAAPKN